MSRLVKGLEILSSALGAPELLWFLSALEAPGRAPSEIASGLVELSRTCINQLDQPPWSSWLAVLALLLY